MPGPSKFQHVYRAFSVFAIGFAIFVVVRWALVPGDFGVYGFYRAGALTEARALPVRYGGQALCLDCHSDIDEARKGARHDKVTCEACHGPLNGHANSVDSNKPRALNPRVLCLQCHTQLAGKPPTFPQIVPADHGGDGPCSECHKPHRPKIERPRP